MKQDANTDIQPVYTLPRTACQKCFFPQNVGSGAALGHGPSTKYAAVFQSFPNVNAPKIREFPDCFTENEPV
jgi:hypothetical protein